MRSSPTPRNHLLGGVISFYERVPVPVRWGETFGGDDTAAAAMIDRLVHHAEVVVLKGDSYRLRGRDLGKVPNGGS